nr:Chain C, MAP KINASE KINASE PBS2 [Saccharomyces cerevisiae]
NKPLPPLPLAGS